jgi:hypothetical protein
MKRWKRALLPVAMVFFALQGPASARDAPDPLTRDKCRKRAEAIFLGKTRHDETMRNDFAERCRTRARIAGIRAKERGAESHRADDPLPGAQPEFEEGAPPGKP